MSRPMPNLKWYVIFWDQPDVEVLLDEPGDILGRFDIASQFGHIAHRKIMGMWIIRHGDEGDDVLRTHGLVPVAISGRFYAATRQRER
jgi:hypothetical protein